MHRSRWCGSMMMILLCLTACQPQRKQVALEQTRFRAWEPPQTFSLPEAMGRLVPQDAVGLLYLTSVAEAEEDAAWLEGLFEHEPSNGRTPETTEAEAEDILAAVTKLYGVRPERIDHKRPLAIALGLVNLGRPTPLPVFIIPVLDRQGVMDDVASKPGRPEPLSYGDYMALTMMPGQSVGEKTPEIGIDLPARRVAIRLRTGRILSILQPFIDQGIAAMRNKMGSPDRGNGDEEKPGPVGNSSALQGTAMLQWMVELLRSWEQVDLGIGTREKFFDIDFAVRTGPDAENRLLSPENARGLVDLARCLPKDYSFLGLTAVDYSGFVKTLEPAYIEMIEEAFANAPEEAKAGYLSWVRTSFDLYRQFRQGLTAFEFYDHGFEIVMVWVVEDPSFILQQYHEMLEEPFLRSVGVTVESAASKEIEGVSVQTYRFHLDPAKLDEVFEQKAEGEKRHQSSEERRRLIRHFFGGEEVTLQMAAFEDKVILVCDPDAERMGQIVAGLRHGTSRLPESLQEVAAGVQDPLCLYFRGDLRNLLASMAGLAVGDSASAEAKQVISALKFGNDVPISKYVTAGTRNYRGQFHLDVVDLAELVRALERLRGGQHDQEE